MGRKREKKKSAVDPSSSMSAEEKLALWNRYLDRDIDVMNGSKTNKRESKSDRKSDKHDFKLDKLDSKTAKSLASAAKRTALASVLKWIVILIGVVYAITKTGGLGGGDLLEKAKGLFGG
mgnify:FL=1